nr:small integral membrane protein 12-like isoform X2 [Meriones unguiculatus]
MLPEVLQCRAGPLGGRCHVACVSDHGAFLCFLVSFPVAFVVRAVGYHLEWFITGKDSQPVEEKESILERREDRKLEMLPLPKDLTQVKAEGRKEKPVS